MAKLRYLVISLLVAFNLFIVFPQTISAHQPRMPGEDKVIVESPEISKAYYAILKGNPHTYTISLDKELPLYVNILVPDISNQKTDFIVTIVQKGKTNKNIARLDGTKFEWTKFFEPFGHDTYLSGPEYRATSPAGVYEITVTAKDNGSKYILAIGEAENFDFKESINAINLIPKIKSTIFDKFPIDFILSPIGIGYIIIVYILSFVFAFLFKFAMKKLASKKIQRLAKNIGVKDRLIRAIFGFLFLFLAITTSWSPILIFVSGFLFFEAIFS